MAHDLDTVLGWRGSTVLDRDGEKIGALKELYLDQDDRPEWGAVHTGLFGLRQTFVPLSDARPVEGGIQLPFTKDHVNDAPGVDPDAQLSRDEENRLYGHYERETLPDDPRIDDPDRGEAPVPTDDAEDDGETGRTAARGDTAGREDAAETIRSEEELVVGTRRRVSGKARLKKYVVTEHVQRTIPVKREKVRIEYDDEAADPARDRTS